MVNEKMEENINFNQFGGMGAASTTDALVEMIHRWSEATDKLDHYVRVALLDFSKAFDLINHNTLLFNIIIMRIIILFLETVHIQMSIYFYISLLLFRIIFLSVNCLVFM